jgi:hypothetical protein
MWFTTKIIDDNELAGRLKHEGIRAGEIIAYRAWRVIVPGLFRDSDDRLHSVFMRDYVWHADQPASGDVRRHGIYSFRNVIRSNDDYGYAPRDEPLLFGKVKIWGEVVEHEWGYRSQFGKIVSLDYGDPDLLEKFRKIYRVNQVLAEQSTTVIDFSPRSHLRFF